MRRSLALVLLAALILPLLPSSAMAIAITMMSAPSVTTVNGVSSFRIDGSTGGNNETCDSATFTFPANADVSGASVEATMATSGIVYTGTATISSASNATHQVVILTGLPRNKPADTYAITISGIVNPSHVGSYSYSVTTVSSTNKTATSSSTFSLTANTNAPSAGAVTESQSLELTATSLTFPLTVGTAGRVTTDAAPAGTVTPDTISVTFPAGMLPATVPAVSSVTVGGVAAQAISFSGNTAIITMGSKIARSSSATIAFTSAFGLVNPGYGTYTLQVATSSETGTATSGTFTVTPQSTKLLVSSAAGRPAAATLQQDQTACVDGFVLQRSTGVTISVSAVRITNSGSMPSTNVVGVQVYRDNGDGAYGTGDTALNASAATFPAGQSTATVTFDSPTLVTSTPITYWVVYTIGPLPTPDGTTANSTVVAVTSGAATTVNTATTGSTFTLQFANRLSVTITPGAVSFGPVDPATVVPTQTITVDVISAKPYTVTRTVTGDIALMGLTVTGTSPGSHAKGTASYTDGVTINIPWTTPADQPLTASVSYTVVQDW